VQMERVQRKGPLRRIQRRRVQRRKNDNGVDCVSVVFRKMTVVNVKYASKLLLLAHQYLD